MDTEMESQMAFLDTDIYRRKDGLLQESPVYECCRAAGLPEIEKKLN
jgi:hypothetical protein